LPWLRTRWGTADPLGFSYAALAAALVLATAALALPWLRTRRDAADPLAARPSVRRVKAKKERLRNAKKAAVRASGLPLGQHAARKWIVLDLGLRPAPGTYSLDPGDWRLTITLPGGASATLDYADIVELGVARHEDCQWHCVTGWSATGLSYDGVPLARVLAHPKVLAAAGGVVSQWAWLYQRAADGFSIPVLREDAMAEDSLLALSFNGEPLTMEHGGPQLLLPALYGWKSDIWMAEIQLLEAYQPGFWERCGCHPRGRHAFNERFREGLSAAIWAGLAAAPGVYRLVGGYSVWIWVMQVG